MHANNYKTQGIDPISMYPDMCSGLNIVLPVLVVRNIRMLDRHNLVYTPSDMADSQTGSYCVRNILISFVSLSQRNESGKAMNQLFKVCTGYRNSYSNDRKLARNSILWPRLCFS